MQSGAIPALGRGSLTLQVSDDDAGLFRAGEVVKAEVLGLVPGNNASIRVNSRVLTVQTEVPVQKGELLSLRVEHRKNLIYLRLAGAASETIGSVKNFLLPVLGRFRELRPAADGMQKLADLLTEMPAEIRRSLPEIDKLEGFLIPPERLSGKVLRDAVRQGGVYFETKLRILALGMEDEGAAASLEAKRIIAGDLKAALLRLKDTMLQKGFFDTLGSRGMRSAEILDGINSVLRTIEFYQLHSKLTESLQFFLPLLWKELKDGEVVLREWDRGHPGEEAFSCSLHLNLHRTGRIGADLLLQRGLVQVTCETDNRSFCSVLQEHAGALQKQLESSGLRVAGLTFRHQQPLEFDLQHAAGLSIRA